MKKEFKPQKTSISVTKRVFSVLVALLLIVVSCVGVYAVMTPSGTIEMQSTNGIAINGSNFADYSNYVVYWANHWSGDYKQGVYAQSDNVYYTTYTTNGNVHAVVASPDNNAKYASVILRNDFTFMQAGVSGLTLSAHDNNTNLFYTDTPSNNNIYIYVSTTSYTTLSEALDSIANVPAPETANSLNISLPAGNVLIADISNTGSNQYYLETTSGTTGATVRPGMNNIQIGYSNTVPASFTVPNSSWDYPSWSGAGSASVLGTYNRQSTQGDFALSNTDALKYVIITNPMYPNDNNASANRLNSDLNITVDKVNSYVIYSLQTGYVSGNLVGTNDGSQYIDYEYDVDIGEWVGTNQDGDPASPVWGGQNDFENTPTTINDWLENIAHQISSFFSGAIGAITTLSVAVKNFAGTLMSLYVWLPSPVLNILSSAVMLAIVIGVIKVFI